MTLGTRGETPQGAEELQRVSRSSVSDAIVDQIIDLISRRVLQPGDRLPSERELCTRFGVGRTSVREALHSLSVMGILDGRVGSGTFVSDDSRYLEKTLEWGLLLDPKRVEDLVETRLMLESQTAYWAAQRATEENLGVMATTLQGMAAAVDEPDRAGWRWHARSEAHGRCETVPPRVLYALNRVLEASRSTVQLVHDGERLTLVKLGTAPDSLAALSPIALAAATLLTEADRRRIRQCGSQRCVLWFLDTSKNGRRRWCSMATCGNRAKAARHYQKQKAAN